MAFGFFRGPGRKPGGEAGRQAGRVRVRVQVIRQRSERRVAPENLSVGSPSDEIQGREGRNLVCECECESEREGQRTEGISAGGGCVSRLGTSEPASV